MGFFTGAYWDDTAYFGTAYWDASGLQPEVGPGVAVITPEPLNEFVFLEGRLEVIRDLNLLCWEELVSAWKFVQDITEEVRLVFRVPKNHRFILQGFELRAAKTLSKLWARFDYNRNPLGWFTFFGNLWQRFSSYSLEDVRWVTGDSNKPPPGWQPLLPGTTGIDPRIIEQLEEKYVKISSGRYSYYAVRYRGY